MTDFKILGRCFACRKSRFFVKRRSIKLPIGLYAKSRELICKKCSHKTQKVIK